MNHSQRLSEKPLNPWVIAEKDGKILVGHCDCIAGLGTHVMYTNMADRKPAHVTATPIAEGLLTGVNELLSNNKITYSISVFLVLEKVIHFCR